MSSDEEVAVSSTKGSVVSGTSTYGRIRHDYSKGYNKPPIPTSGYAVYILICFDFMDSKTGPATMRRSYNEWSEYFRLASQMRNNEIIPPVVVNNNYKVEKMYKVGKTSKGLRRYFGKYPAISINPPGRDLWLFETYVQFSMNHGEFMKEFQNEVETDFNKTFMLNGLRKNDGEGGVEIIFNTPLAKVKEIVYLQVLETTKNKIKRMGLQESWKEEVKYNDDMEWTPPKGELAEINPHLNGWWATIYACADEAAKVGDWELMFKWLSNVGIDLLHFPDFSRLEMGDRLTDRGDINSRDRPRYLRLRDFMRDYVSEANKAALNPDEGGTIDQENPPAPSTSQRNIMAVQQELIRETTVQRENAKRQRHKFSREKAILLREKQFLVNQIARLESGIKILKVQLQKSRQTIDLHYRLEPNLRNKVQSFFRALRLKRRRNSLMNINKIKF